MNRKEPIVVLYFIAIILGLLTGIVGSCFQLAIHQMSALLHWGYQQASLLGIPLVLTAALLSMLMVFIAWLMVHCIAPEAAGSGVQEIEGALVQERPIFWRRLLPVKFIAGVLAISAKMVLGREGPTIQMGGNIGEMLGEYARLSQMHRSTLIAAGASAGLAVAFNAPLAGVLFVMEEMRNQFKPSFTNMTIAAICCVVATIMLHKIIGAQAVITMDVFALPSLQSLWLFVIFGIVVGLVGLLFNITLVKSLDWTDRFPRRLRMLFVLLVGALVGGLSITYPAMVGGGYDIIEQTLQYVPSFPVVALLLVIRFAMTMLSYSTGVPGGIFAPMLALGTLLGLLASFFMHHMLNDSTIHPGMFAVAGMGALFAAAVRAPVTGIVLVVEMTQNYMLILPLMVTCLTATTVVQMAGNLPIYTQLLRRVVKRSGPHI
ncbi:MAG: H(+)/Cl(-) exchange transporter ClcA [Legionellaceae bacterium]|nr:H(+)/Cl(-) exchange transporter ClcA [Legionellaceae bacterium]